MNGDETTIPQLKNLVSHENRYGTELSKPQGYALYYGYLEPKETEKLPEKAQNDLGFILRNLYTREDLVKKYCIDIDMKGNERVMPGRVAELFMNLYHFKTMTDTHEIFYYQDGVYKIRGEELISNRMKRILHNDLSSRMSTEAMFHVKASTYSERDEMPPNILNLKNGLYDLETNELSKHNPEKFVTTQIPVDYVKGAKPERSLEFIKAVLQPEAINMAQELFGYCLYRDYQYHKIFLLHGRGGNGKSTFLNLLSRMIGTENISTETLQDLVYNRFSKSALFGKMANINADISATKITQTGIIKQLTGQDRITAERKHQRAFQFSNYAKLIFSANELPSIKDDTDAMIRRVILFDFSKSFIGDDEVKNLIEVISTPQELSGLVNWGIEGLQRLLSQRDFSMFMDMDEIKDRLKRASSTVIAFIQDCVTEDENAMVPKETLYNEYLIYCKKENFKAVGPNEFNGELRQTLVVTDSRPDGPKGSPRPRCWAGIRVKEQTLTERQDTVQKELIKSTNMSLEVNNNTYNEISGKLSGQLDRHGNPKEHNLLKGTTERSLTVIENLEKDEDNKEGIAYGQLYYGLLEEFPGFKDEEIEDLITKLSKDGLIFEPKSGLWRRL